MPSTTTTSRTAARRFRTPRSLVLLVLGVVLSLTAFTGAASAGAPAKLENAKAQKVSKPGQLPGGGKSVARAAGLRTTLDHTEYRNRKGGYELARTYADQAINTSGRCAAYAGIEKTTDYLARVGARRPSAATPILRALSPIYKVANWLVGKFFTTPCDLAKQLTKTAATVTAVAYWDGEVYHRVHIQKDTRGWGQIDLCRFAAHTYFRSGGQWWVVQTMNAHLPARGDWGDCRP